mgnify:FL=1
MISTLKRIASAVLIASLVVPVTGTVFAAPAADEFSASVTPTSTSPGQTQTYTLTVTNGQGSKIKSISVDIAPGFSVTTASVVSPSGWSVSTTTTAGKFRLEKSGANRKI